MIELPDNPIVADAISALRKGGFVPIDEAATMLGCSLRDILEKVNRAGLASVQVTALNFYSEVEGHRMPSGAPGTPGGCRGSGAAVAPDHRRNAHRALARGRVRHRVTDTPDATCVRMLAWGRTNRRVSPNPMQRLTRG